MFSWSVAASCFSVFYGLLQLSVASKYLERSDFGVYSIISIVIGFGLVLSDVGISSGFMQKKDICENDIGSAIFVSAIQSTLVCLLIFLLFPVICDYYNNNDINNYHKVVALIFACNPFISIGLSYEQKKYKIKLISIIEIFAGTIAFIIFIIILIYGKGVDALIWGSFSAVLVKGLLYINLIIKNWGWRVFLKLDYKNLIFFWKISFFQIVSESINYFNVQIDSIIIGKIFGVANLGTYNAAKQLAFRPIGFINPVISRILLPVLAGVRHKNNLLVANLYIEVINGLVVVHGIIFSTLFIFGKEICEIIFKNRWGDVDLYFSILCLYVMQRAISNPVGVLMSVYGENKRIAIWNIGMFFYMPTLVMMSFGLGQKFVPIFLAAGFILAHFPAWYFLVNKVIKINFSTYFCKQSIILLEMIFLFVPIYLYDNFLLKIIHYSISGIFFLLINVNSMRKLKNILSNKFYE